MRPALLAILLTVLPPAAVRAADAPSAANEAAIQQVITAQIEAFRHNDGDAALAFAAPSIRQRFGDGAHFLDMVRQGYAPVFRPHSFTFAGAALQDGVEEETMHLVGPDGHPAVAVYDMEHEGDGSWRILGCRLVESKLQET